MFVECSPAIVGQRRPDVRVVWHDRRKTTGHVGHLAFARRAGYPAGPTAVFMMSAVHQATSSVGRRMQHAHADV